MAYNLYASVDGGYNFSPEVRDALAGSSEITEAVNTNTEVVGNKNKNVQQDTRLTNIETKNTAQDAAITDTTTKYGGLSSRIALVETKNTAQDTTLVSLSTKVLQRGDLSSADNDLFTLLTNEHQGRWRVTSLSVKNTPTPSLGYVDVLRNGTDGRVTLIYTVSNTGPTVQYSAVYASGSWGAWIPSTWNMGLLKTGIDWNTLKYPALYGIQFTKHPNQMAPTVGTLEVLLSSGNIIQRFTEDAAPHTVWYRKFNGTTWSEPEPAGGFSTPERGELRALTISTTSKSGSQIMMSMSKDRLRGWNQNTSSVSETRDDGVTWTQINDKDAANPFAGSTVESVRQLDNGELLITCLRGATSRREIWVSDKLDDPAERTFTRTLEVRAPFIKFTSAWSQDDNGPIVIVNEYGPKTPTWTGQAVAEGENARYTYLSTDYGLTWNSIFDLNNYLTNTQGRASVDNQHLHGVAWDPYWDRIWVTFGDNMGGNGSNGIVYSDDMGVTWETAHYYTGTTPPHQCVGIQPMPKCVLFFTDNVTPGRPDVVRIDRKEGRYKAGGYTTVDAWESTAEGKHLCQGSSRIMRRGDDAPALAAYCSEGTPAPSFAIATMDGYKFKEIWRDGVDNPSGFGSRSIVGPTKRGKVIISSNDQKVEGMWSEIKMEAPGY